jgi:putative flavoprotein involved in K+ transport
MPAEQIETLVIGGGQAGLVMSHRLKQRGLAHLVLERHRIGERWEQRGPHRSKPLITGAFGGNTIDFRRFAAQGVTLLGRMEATHQGVIDFASDLAKRLAYGDVSYAIFLDMVDAYVDRHGLNMPKDPAARAVLPDPPCINQPLRRLDISTEGIGAVIWATGYGFDFGWINVPVLDARGAPLHRRGITDVPGLYFLGLQWLSTLNSSILSGVGDDAAVLADHIAARG